MRVPLQGPLFDTIHNSLNVKLLGEPYCMGAHLTTFPATYQWMHDPDTFPVSSDVKRLPQELRPHALNQSDSGSMQNGILVPQGLLGFTHDMVTSLLPILNAISADTAARPYKLPVLKTFAPVSDWYGEQFIQATQSDEDLRRTVTAFRNMTQIMFLILQCLVLQRPTLVTDTYFKLYFKYIKVH